MYASSFFELAHKYFLLGFSEEYNIPTFLLYFRRNNNGHSSGDYEIPVSLLWAVEQKQWSKFGVI